MLFTSTTFSKVATGYLALVAAGFLALQTAGADSVAPSLTQVPADRIAFQGEQVTFETSANGSAPITFQWFQNGASIPGANGQSFVLSSVTAQDDQSVISVGASNAGGQVISSNALLTVKAGIVLAASVNDRVRVTVRSGWPLILELGLLHPEMFDSNVVPILICSTNGAWSNALEVRAIDTQGQLQNWPMHGLPLTNEFVQLTDEMAGTLVRWLSPADTAQLAMGSYELTATLSTTNVPKLSAWKGVARSVPVTITITNPPAILTDEDAEERARLFARYALLEGNRPQARQEIDSLLASHPTNIGGLTINMYLQRDAGQLGEALRTTEKALAQVYAQSPLTEEPPAELLQNLAELRALLIPPHLIFTLAAGQLTLQWDGRPDTQYKLESSENLAAWAVRSTNFTVIDNNFSWTTNVTSPQQFFRISF